ncbi:hypothetical protein [Echinicola salinicaeni]|uniref:hypothetical protein n=1 Tax=Echinicola salinicaeni TaxID=2762757 RepID=UPI001646219E|nr:hypothetical protein [Echinicola salinicaeni]
MRNPNLLMVESININFDKVHEMSEGDVAFEKELLHAISNSVKELKERYLQGLDKKDPEILHQARHKVKPTITIFELRKLSFVLENGRNLINTKGLNADLDNHYHLFEEAVNDLLADINSTIN